METGTTTANHLRSTALHAANSSESSVIVEKSLVTTLRIGIVSALALPFGLAGLAAAMTNHQPPLDVIAPIVALAALVFIACWARVLVHWRDPDGPDDDDPWRRGGGPDGVTPPDGSSDGPSIDWTAFEREFAAYVTACERVREGVLAAVSAALRPATHAIARASAA